MATPDPREQPDGNMIANDITPDNRTDIVRQDAPEQPDLHEGDRPDPAVTDVLAAGVVRPVAGGEQGDFVDDEHTIDRAYRDLNEFPRNAQNPPM